MDEIDDIIEVIDIDALKEDLQRLNDAKVMSESGLRIGMDSAESEHGTDWVQTILRKVVRWKEPAGWAMCLQSWASLPRPEQ